jgi:hypothetical protein
VQRAATTAGSPLTVLRARLATFARELGEPVSTVEAGAWCAASYGRSPRPHVTRPKLRQTRRVTTAPAQQQQWSEHHDTGWDWLGGESGGGGQAVTDRSGFDSDDSLDVALRRLRATTQVSVS